MCASCTTAVESGFLRREIVGLVVLSVVVVAGFLLTRSVAATNSELRSRDASEWYSQGQRALQSNQPAEAVRALRRATALDADVRDYRLALAEALTRTNDYPGARQVLIGLREGSPESPDVNVRLAQVEAKAGNLDEAVRYYQSALHGSWASDQDEARRRLRLEFIRYLLAHGQRSRAVSELIVLTGNLPAESSAQNEAGHLLLDAGEPARALEQFRRVLTIDETNQDALAGAGVAAFETGDYPTAQRYLRSVESATSPRVSEAKLITDLVIARDPLRAGLRLEERRTRVSSAFTHATSRLDTCLAGMPSSDERRRNLEVLMVSAAAIEPMLRASNVRRSPDVIDAAFDLVYRIEQETADGCGPPEPLDRALVLIGRRHGTDQTS